jgi:hypothetical protein
VEWSGEERRGVGRREERGEKRRGEEEAKLPNKAVTY